MECAGVQLDDGCGMKEDDRVRTPCTTPKEAVSGGSGYGIMVVDCRSSSLGFSVTPG